MKKGKGSLGDFIISWNLRFKYDRLWRKKYNVSFGSEIHRNTSQIDIYLDILEDQLFMDVQERILEREKNAEQYKKGIFLKEQIMSEKAEDDLLKGVKF